MADYQEQSHPGTQEIERLKARLAACEQALAEAEQRAAEAERRAAVAEESRRVLQALMAHSPGGIVVADANASIRDVSERARAITGESWESIRESTLENRAGLLRLFHADGVTPATGEELPLTRAVRQGETITDEEWILRRRDGSQAVLLTYAAPTRDDAGNVTGAVLMWLDITERKRAEDSLRASEAWLRAVVENLPVGFWARDTVGRSILQNAAARELWQDQTGRLPEESGVDAQTLARWQENNRRAYAGEVVREETEYLVRGKRRHLQETVAPIRDGDRLLGILGIIADVTPFRQAQESLQRQQRLLDAILGNIMTHVAYMDNDFNIVLVNATYAQGAGHPISELVGRNHFELFPNEENQRIFERVRDTGEPYITYSKPFVFPDQPERGVTYWDWWLRAIRNPEGKTEGVVLSLTDVTESERRRREVERLNEELREANAAKDTFLSVLSHELRGPLAPVLAGVDVLRRLLPEEGRHRRVLDAIERNTKLQARLVNDLLDLSRIARGKMQFQRVPIPLDAVVNAAAQDQQAEVHNAGLSLQVQASSGVWVLGDFDRLQQVVINLLNNAVKFTPPGGKVCIRVTGADGRGLVVVEDTGIGMDGATLSRVFEMFQQGEVAGVRKPGLGIGLPLVKIIAEAHGGRAWAESEGLGKGSRFFLELPLVAAPNGNAPASPHGAEVSGIRVLVVEDSLDALSMLSESLSLMGYVVRTATSAEDALELLQRERPDIILSDIGLGAGMDGYELLRRARELPGLADTPAFAITGWGQEADVRRAHEAGYAGHFTKPVDVSHLDQRIREWEGSARDRRG